MKAPEPTGASLRDFLNVIFKRKYQILLFFFVIFSMFAFATRKANQKPSRRNCSIPGQTTKSTSEAESSFLILKMMIKKY